MDLREERVRRRMLDEGPIGEWRTRPGTDTVLMEDDIRFGPEGTGAFRQDSVLLGEHVQPFGNGWALCDPRWEGFWDLVSPVVPLRAR